MKSRKDNVRALQRSVSELNIDIHTILEEQENQCETTLQDLARKSSLKKLHTIKLNLLEDAKSNLMIAKIDSILLSIDNLQKDIK